MKLTKTSIRLVKEKTYEYETNTIKTPKDMVAMINKLEDMENLSDEHVFLICLNNKNTITNYCLLSKGGVNMALIDIRNVFKTVLLSNSTKFILMHNHPSDDCTPSKADIEITNKIKDASKIMHIDFLDHIIVTKNDYKSIL